MSNQELIEKLQNNNFIASTREGLGGYPGSTPVDIERVTKWTSALRDDLVTLIREIEDEAEVRMTIAINYIELKSRWIALNTKMNYQNFRTGSCDVMTAMRGAGISQLLAHVESLLTQEEIDQITEFLAEPVRRAA